MVSLRERNCLEVEFEWWRRLAKKLMWNRNCIFLMITKFLFFQKGKGFWKRFVTECEHLTIVSEQHAF